MSCFSQNRKSYKKVKHTRELRENLKCRRSYRKRVLAQIFSWICSNKLRSFGLLSAPVVSSAGPRSHQPCLFPIRTPSSATLGTPSHEPLPTPPSTDQRSGASARPAGPHRVSRRKGCSGKHTNWPLWLSQNRGWRERLHSCNDQITCSAETWQVSLPEIS